MLQSVSTNNYFACKAMHAGRSRDLGNLWNLNRPPYFQADKASRLYKVS
jgi:hypothetical protein